MPLDLSDTLVIGISATALFDLSEADKLFRAEFAKDRDNAIDVYRRYMLERENEPLATGTGLPLVRSLLRLKHLSPDEERPLVEVVVMSRNSPETGLRVLNTIRHLKLDITRSVFTGGESVVDYLDAFDVDLFLTTYAKDAQRVIDSKVCPAALLATPPSGIDALRDDQVRIAFDGDAVLFDESSELVYKTEGLAAFQTAEDQAQDRPLTEGPYATFLKKLARLQERLPGRIEFSPVRIALVTARNSPAELRWKYDRDTHQRHVEEQRLYWGPDESYEYPRLKSFLSEASDGMVPIDVWHYKNTRTTDDGGKAIKALFGFEAFTNPKPPSLIRRAIALSPIEPDKRIIMDFLAGSASTAEAVLQENREAEVCSKYILVEIGEHFDTVMLPRICKVAYAANWRDGKPRSRDEGLSHLAKYIRLESYEDALNNLETRRTDIQQTLLGSPETQGAEGLKEQYLLRYMLDVETRGSQSLLNVQAFKDPTAYKLKVRRPSSDESREVNVDLLETFNYLIGLTAQHIAAPQTFAAEFERDSEKRLRLKSRLRQDAAGPWWFRTVTGTTPDGRRTLVIWRKLTGDPEQDNPVLGEWFTRQGYSTKDYEFQLIYVNGDNNLDNLKAPDDTWKVRLIEEDFHRLMFDMEGV